MLSFLQCSKYEKTKNKIKQKKLPYWTRFTFHHICRRTAQLFVIFFRRLLLTSTSISRGVCRVFRFASCKIRVLTANWRDTCKKHKHNLIALWRHKQAYKRNLHDETGGRCSAFSTASLLICESVTDLLSCCLLFSLSTDITCFNCCCLNSCQNDLNKFVVGMAFV